MGPEIGLKAKTTTTRVRSTKRKEQGSLPLSLRRPPFVVCTLSWATHVQMDRRTAAAALFSLLTPFSALAPPPFPTANIVYPHPQLTRAAAAPPGFMHSLHYTDEQNYGVTFCEIALFYEPQNSASCVRVKGNSVRSKRSRGSQPCDRLRIRSLLSRSGSRPMHTR